MSADFNFMQETFSTLIKLIPLLIPLVIIQFGLMIAALVNLLKKNVKMENKIVWVIVIVFVNLFGPLIYFIFGSKQLDKKIAESEERE